MGKKWGGVDQCPACLKSVYPLNRVFAADRKAFCKGCIQCQVKGCQNELTERGIHKHDGFNVCDKCHEEFYAPKAYGPPAGGESLDEARAREAREKAERERKLREIEEMRRRGGNKDDLALPGCIKIAETVMIMSL